MFYCYAQQKWSECAPTRSHAPWDSPMFTSARAPSHTPSHTLTKRFNWDFCQVLEIQKVTSGWFALQKIKGRIVTFQTRGLTDESASCILQVHQDGIIITANSWELHLATTIYSLRLLLQSVIFFDCLPNCWGCVAVCAVWGCLASSIHSLERDQALMAAVWEPVCCHRLWPSNVDN